MKTRSDQRHPRDASGQGTTGYADDGWLAHDPDLDVLRDHPDFIALLATRQAGTEVTGP